MWYILIYYYKPRYSVIFRSKIIFGQSVRTFLNNNFKENIRARVLMMVTQYF